MDPLKKMKEVAEFAEANANYFDIDEVRIDHIYLATREHGNVGDEEYGEEDYQEAKRVKKLIEEKFAPAEVEIETCDEWVSISINPNPDPNVLRLKGIVPFLEKEANGFSTFPHFNGYRPGMKSVKLTSIRHGDFQSGTHGQEDLDEAERVKKIAKKLFKDADFNVSTDRYEVVLEVVLK